MLYVDDEHLILLIFPLKGWIGQNEQILTLRKDVLLHGI